MCVPLFAEQDDAEKNAAEESSHRHADDDSQKQTCHTRRHSKVSEWPCTTAHGARFHVHADCTVDMILLNLPKEPIFRADILGGVLLISLIVTVTLTETMNFIQVYIDLPTTSTALYLVKNINNTHTGILHRRIQVNVRISIFKSDT